MSDDTAPTSSTGSHFCGECGASVEADATFCGECGSATSFAAGGADDAEGGEDVGPGGASTWDGVETVVDRGDETAAEPLPPPAAPPVTVPVPNVPPPPGPATIAAPAVPPPGAPGPGGPEGPGGPGGPGDGKDGAKGNGPKILVGALVLVALLVAAFAFLGGGDDGGDEGSDTTFERDDEDPDEDPDDETTTTAEGETTTTDPGTDTTVDAGFVNLVDDTGRLTVDVPADWTDVSLAPDDGLSRILAATDADAFQTGFAAPGVDLRLLETPLAPEQFDSSLDTVANTILLPNSCTSQGKEDYTDGVFTGRMETWGECAEIGTQMVLLFASQADGQTVFVGLQLTAEDDPAIADRVLDSFLIVG